MDISSIMEKMAEGDSIEMQIFIFFAGIVVAIIFVFFAGRAFMRKKPTKTLRMDRKPVKSWKNFCDTK